MKRAVIAIIGICLSAWVGYAISHSGGLDAFGCHKDHSTGEYHCHR